MAASFSRGILTILERQRCKLFDRLFEACFRLIAERKEEAGIEREIEEEERKAAIEAVLSTAPSPAFTRAATSSRTTWK